MDALLLPGHWLAAWLGMEVGTLRYLCLAWSINVPLWSAALRTALIVPARALGLYHPAFYCRWPRLPWRSLVKAWDRTAHWYEQVFAMGRRATGRFAGPLSTLARLYRPGHVLLGRAQGWGFGLLQPVGMTVERHLFMYAMTGAGKTVKLISILSTWNSSAFVIDPKGQITAALAANDWRRWFVLDPYGIWAGISACFNAFDCLKEAMSRSGKDVAVLWALRIAQALIVTPSGSRSPYFTDTARSFLAGLILFVLEAYPPGDHNLPFVRDLIVHGLRVYDKEGKEITKGDEAHALLLMR